MHRGVKKALIIVGILAALFIILLLVLIIVGSQEVVDPFTEGIDVIDVPYSAPATVTWRIVGPAASDTALYVSTMSKDVADGTSPQAAGYSQRIEPRKETVDGVEIYRADAPAGFIRVYAEIGGPKWSSEFEVEP